MKFDNEDAFKLAVAFMNHKENATVASSYFKTFIDTYQKFDRWLSASDPVSAMKAEKAAAKAQRKYKQQQTAADELIAFHKK